MELTCYVYPGWKPRLRAASPRRAWMDASPESFAYRCLPLGIANAHGWELLSPCGFQAHWNGGPLPQDVRIQADPGTPAQDAPVALFGQGTFTFHVPGLFRTSPGHNLWVGGSPNLAKDGVAALGGIIETDWAPYTFTMNWRFTRAGHVVRFEENEPLAFLFPLPRDLLDAVVPRIAPIDEAPELKRRFEQWSQARDAFQAQVAATPQAAPGAKWQKFYFRGTDADGAPGAADHRSRLRLPGFEGAAPPPAGVPAADCPHARGAGPALPPSPDASEVLARLQRLRALSARNRSVPRRGGLTAGVFLDEYYAANWPVLLAGEIEEALGRWAPQALVSTHGDAPLVDAHGQASTLGRFVQQALRPADAPGRQPRLTGALETLPDLAPRLGHLMRLLRGHDPGQLWLEAAGSGTLAAPEPCNRLLLQLHGQRRLWLAPPGEAVRLQPLVQAGALGDLTTPDLSERQPQLRGLELHAVLLQPGDALFVPFGWWRQGAAMDFSVSVTREDFHWPNPP
ncbi:hypothetical protein EA658_17020 [Pseudoxanthomonas winnipegensis]|jgi:hypothetical protein|uniref:JmjC domain-containing protein n=1 Tax=Pseudoxanthomonas winnipegensis TaxID=2480810 RepID=A0ABY1WAF1_9GAMM|nr:DUF6065 family protein [Pseudoxanthomonas winnipegensis]TAA07492.1 hypothetical protein EA659_16525 [Pseudoxanthomonas winnipegensis]TAA17519.1 hypothetical protein EA658_17020 [Pseudoxanthomonas winnipegensis]TAH71239.1 hypothetical protein EA657_13560 [Pseudoxanthomonas winnipegensis]